MKPQFTVYEFHTEDDLVNFLNNPDVPCQAEEPKKEEKPTKWVEKSIFGNLTDCPAKPLTGGKVNYYLAKVEHPQRKEQAPYQAECEDLITALKLTFDEANIFKEIWRSANARMCNGKPGHSALYGAEKIVHYASRILKAEQQKG